MAPGAWPRGCGRWDTQARGLMREAGVWVRYRRCQHLRLDLRGLAVSGDLYPCKVVG